MKYTVCMEDSKILLLTTFIDVLEVIERYQNMEEVKADIKNRKRIIKQDIKRIKKKQKREKEEFYPKKDVDGVLRGIELFLDRCEWVSAREYLDIVINENKNMNIQNQKTH